MSGYESFETVLVAAGLSKRMGKVNKLLIEVDGEPLVRRTAGLYHALGMSVIVVLGHQADIIAQALLGLPVKAVLNPDYETGQQHSVRAGLEACQFSKPGIMIALADQPCLSRADIRQFCDAFLDGPRDQIMVPYFRGMRGNPVIFPSFLAKRAHDMQGQTSYRSFIDTHPERVSRYDAPNDHFTSDIDTPEDAQTYLEG